MNILTIITKVTILILVDGFLQYMNGEQIVITKESHNPYFSRWFSAIKYGMNIDHTNIKSQSLF